MRVHSFAGAGLAFVVATMAGACLRFDAFSCADALECNAGDGGMCLDGACAYPDLECPSGLRYDEHAGSGNGSACVEFGGTTTMPATTSTTAASSEAEVTTEQLDVTGDPTSGEVSTEGSSTTGEPPQCGGQGEACCDVGESCLDGLSCQGSACGCVAQIDAGDRHTCAVLGRGEVYCWGANDRGQLGASVAAFETSPVAAFTPTPLDPSRQVVAFNHTCVRTELGNVRCFGANDSGQILPAAPGGNLPITDAIWAPSANHVGVGIGHVCAADGLSLICWGANGQNQLASVEAEPGPYSFGTGPVSQLATGGHNGCIVQSGNLSCWGSNNFGQLATDPGVTPTIATPTTMPVLDVAEVAVGRTHWCARTNAGAIHCTGRGDSGQLGNGAAADSVTPVIVSWPLEAGLPVSIVAGEQHTCVIDDAGALWCWGSNAFGQLMLIPDAMGFDGYTTVPVAIPLDDAALAVAAGGTHTCALTDAAELLCWGTNSTGQIGDGTTTYAFEPQPVGLSCPSVGA